MFPVIMSFAKYFNTPSGEGRKMVFTILKLHKTCHIKTNIINDEIAILT